VLVSTIALGAGDLEPPTPAEIQFIESRIELPDGAHPLNEYVRFYYVVDIQGQRTIEGGYVSTPDTAPFKWTGPIVIVRNYEDVPAPYDAGCGVIRIAFVPGLSKGVKASCDPALEMFPPSLAPTWMYALFPLTPFAALLIFAIYRGLASRRAQPESPLAIIPQALLRRWKKEGIKLLPPEPAQAIVDAFARVGSVASRDVIEFYSELGGMEPMDNSGLKIWSLAEILADNEERSEYGPIFADYMISCWSFRLKQVDASTSAVYVDYHRDSQPPELVTNSLAQFLVLYERDPRAAHAH